MTQFITDLTTFLANHSDINEYFRASMEQALNELLQAELTSVLGYEPYDVSGYNSGNSRNGSYTRKFETKYGTLNLIIPRDRNGEFVPKAIPSYSRRDDELEKMIIKLYQTGVTTREIANLIEQMFGHHYSPATVSNITQLTQENVTAFHERKLQERYSIVYLDGTYLPLRRTSVSKECIHIALGITHQGYKEILGYEISPNENNTAWSDLLEKIKANGVKQVSLFVTDGFKGLDQIIYQNFPLAKQQRCLVHISRNIGNRVKLVDRKDILEDFKMLHKCENRSQAQEILTIFMEKWGKQYPKLIQKIADTDNLLTFYDFPPSIRSSIYSTNLIESMNKQIKRQTKKRVVFPNEASLERCLVAYFEEYNLKNEDRSHRGFSACCDTLESFYE